MGLCVQHTIRTCSVMYSMCAHGVQRISLVPKVSGVFAVGGMVQHLSPLEVEVLHILSVCGSVHTSSLCTRGCVYAYTVPNTSSSSSSEECARCVHVLTPTL